MLYIGQQGEPYKTDWVMPCIAVMVVGYFLAVAMEDGLRNDMPTNSQIIHSITDLSNVQLNVVIRFGWRAHVAKSLIKLAKLIGGCQVKFLGDENG